MIETAAALFLSFLAADFAAGKISRFRTLFKIFIFLAAAYFSGFWWAPRLEVSMAFAGAVRESVSLPGEKVALVGPSGEKWSAVLSGFPGSGAVLYFHGNGGSANMFRADADFFRELGYAVLMPDYPGYGESEGGLSFGDSKALAEAAYRHLVGERGIDPARVVIAGYSVGTGPAAYLASLHPESPLALFAPYVSLRRIAAENYGFAGFAPQDLWFLPDPFRNDLAVRSSPAPTLVVHGAEDSLISIGQGREVFSASSSAKKGFLAVPGAGHAGLIYRNGDMIAKAWKKIF